MNAEERKKVYEETKEILSSKIVSETVFNKIFFETGDGNPYMACIHFVDDESEIGSKYFIPGKRACSDGINVWLYVDDVLVAKKPIEEISFFLLKSGERISFAEFEQQYLYGKSGRLTIGKYKTSLQKLVENRATDGMYAELVDDYGQAIYWTISEELQELFQRKCVYSVFSEKLINFTDYVDPEDVSGIEAFPVSDGEELIDIDPEYKGKLDDNEKYNFLCEGPFYKRAYFKLKDGSEADAWSFEDEHLHPKGVDGKEVWVLARFKSSKTKNPKYKEYDELRELCSMKHYMKAVEELVADR